MRERMGRPFTCVAATSSVRLPIATSEGVGSNRSTRSRGEGHRGIQIDEEPAMVFGEGVLPMPFAARVGVGIVACALALPSAAQNPSDVAQHIQHVTSGLIDRIVPQGEEHPTHTLADRMKELNVSGVSIAVIYNGRIEWARGFGVRSIGGPPINPETMFQAGSISKPLAAMACLRLVGEG